MNAILALLDTALDRFRWYRRLCGGHWELWWVETVGGDVWHQLDRCSRDGARPTPLCRGTPICEDYPQRWLGMVDWW